MARTSHRGQTLIELVIVISLLIFCIFVTLDRVTSLRQGVLKSGSEKHHP